jgi:hypothetical protein
MVESSLGQVETSVETNGCSLEEGVGSPGERREIVVTLETTSRDVRMARMFLP